MKRAQSGGYVGLIALLITVALIAFLSWRSDLLSPKQTPAPAGTADLVHGSTHVEQGINAIDAANEAKQRIESNYANVRTEGGY
jgi:hypothetical protein